MKRILNCFAVLCLAIFVFSSLSFAQDEDKLSILISGQSHASLYPCSCPYNPIGGVARRATLVKEIRKENKNMLLLEAGGSFAGGNFDANTQTVELDKERTRFYMQSLVQMGYDAFLVSSKEFNFGDDFLSKSMSKYKLKYLSANVKGKFSPYVIKKFGKFNIAVIGITDKEVTSKSQIEYVDQKEALLKTIKEIKDNQKADFIVILSYLNEDSSKEIIQRVAGVDIWVSSNRPFKKASNEYINGTLFIVPAWQVRSLTRVNINIPAGKVDSLEHIDLNKDIKDDPRIASNTPSCFTDKDCHKTGYVAECKNPGKKKSKCKYSEVEQLKLTIIRPEPCKTCNVEQVIKNIKQNLPNLKIQYLNEDNKVAQEMIKKLNIKMLPAYLIEDSIENEKIISKLDKISKKIDGYYLLEPGFTGVSFIVGRKKIPNRLDLFFDIGSKNIVEILGVLQEFKEKNAEVDIRLNFLAVEDPKLGLIAKGEKYEIEEFLRAACINKHYPDKLWDYLSCRLSDIGSSWWDDCAVKFDMDSGKIKDCARAQEGLELLKDFIKLTQELEVVFGPTFLINNQEIFSSEGVPSAEELKKLFE